jgi:hypothetical protein
MRMGSKKIFHIEAFVAKIMRYVYQAVYRPLMKRLTFQSQRVQELYDVSAAGSDVICLC